MAYCSAKTREKAFRMHCDNISYANIAKKLKVNPVTIHRWKVKYKWAKRKDKLICRVQKESEKKVLDYRLRQIKYCENIQNKGISDMNKDYVAVYPTDTIKAMQHELVLRGDASDRVEIKVDIRKVAKSLEE